MNRVYDEAEDDRWQADEWDDLEDEVAVDTIHCPNCRAEVYEDAEQCPVCGDYIIGSHSAASGPPMWVFVTAAVLLFAMIFLIVAPLLRK